MFPPFKGGAQRVVSCLWGVGAKSLDPRFPHVVACMPKTTDGIIVPQYNYKSEKQCMLMTFYT